MSYLTQTGTFNLYFFALIQIIFFKFGPFTKILVIFLPNIQSSDFIKHNLLIRCAYQPYFTAYLQWLYFIINL